MTLSSGSAVTIRSVLRQLEVGVRLKVANKQLTLSEPNVEASYVRDELFAKLEPVPVGTAHVFVVPRLLKGSYFIRGEMFDLNEADRSLPGRQGAIVAHSGQRRYSRTELFRTLLHEIGHMLNLHHPRQADDFLMTETDLLTNPQNPRFEFSPRDKARAKHLIAKGRGILPGDSPFG